MDELRDNTRKQVIGQAVISAPNGWEPITCSLFNISETGAMVGFPKDYNFPPQFMFQWKGRPETIPAQLVWLREGLAGIRFLATHPFLKARDR